MFRGGQEDIKTKRMPAKVSFHFNKWNQWKRIQFWKIVEHVLMLFMCFSPTVPKILLFTVQFPIIQATPLKAAVQVQKDTFHSLYDKKTVFWIFLL